MQHGSTGVLKDTFLMKERKLNNINCISSNFPSTVFDIPASQQTAQEMFRLEICVLFVQTELLCRCHQRGQLVCVAWGKLQNSVLKLITSGHSFGFYDLIGILRHQGVIWGRLQGHLDSQLLQ